MFIRMSEMFLHGGYIMRAVYHPGGYLYESQRVGHYQLIHPLDQRHIIEVWQAQHVTLQKSVALKILPLHALGEQEFFLYETRLRCEAQALESFDHPHIVGFRDYVLWRPFRAIIMQYAPYGSLARVHPTGHKLPLSLVRLYVEQISSALYALHQRGLLHRDVKPGNILLRAPRHTLLADFGLVRDDPTRGHRRQLPREGTHAYMAPEQYHGYPCAASDQYGLATSVYEWLSGHRPFSGEAARMMHHRVHFAPQPVRTFRPELPRAVDEILLTALDPDPTRRYPCVWDFARAFSTITRTTRPPLVNRIPYYRGALLPDTAELEAIPPFLAHRAPAPGEQRVVVLADQH